MSQLRKLRISRTCTGARIEILETVAVTFDQIIRTFTSARIEIVGINYPHCIKRIAPT